MASFELKADLPLSDQQEIDRIVAIDSAVRTAKEAAFLASREPYIANKVYRSDDDGLILEAEGNTLPTSYSGFKAGALFRDLDKLGRVLYTNVGTSTSAVWQVLGATAVSSTSPSASLSPSSSVSPSVSPSKSPSSSVSPSVSPSYSPSASQSPSASVSPSFPNFW